MSLLEYSKSYVPQYLDLVQITKEHEKIHWHEDEVTLSTDMQQWKTGKITEAEKSLVKNILRLFTSSDVAVGRGYYEKIIPIIKNNEARNMLGSFAARECFDEETELLTAAGWKSVAEVTTDDMVGQFNMRNSEISFTNPTKVVSYPYTGVMHHYSSTLIDLFVTPEHRIAMINPDNFRVTTVPSSEADFPKGSFIPVAGKPLLRPSSPTSVSAEVEGAIFQLLVAAHISGSQSSIGERVVAITVPEDQKKRLGRLIKTYSTALGKPYMTPKMGDNGVIVATFAMPGGVDMQSIKDFDFVGIQDVNRNAIRAVFTEIEHWSDRAEGGHGYVFKTQRKDIADKISALAPLGGYHASVDADGEVYSVAIHETAAIVYPQRMDVDFDGTVYCVSMPETTVVTRRNGKVSISGNSIHQRGYALLSDTLGFGEDFYFEFLEYQEMADKFDFMTEDIGESLEEFAVYLAKQTLIEGVSLYASFCMLLNFDRLGKLPGMCDVVRWSVADEAIHVEGNALLFRTFLNEYPSLVGDDFKRTIYSTARKLVELEDAFIDRAYEFGLVEKLDKEEVKEYIRYITDYRLKQLGLKPNWDIKVDPLPWFNASIKGGHTSFFERNVTSYLKANLTGDFSGGYGG